MNKRIVVIRIRGRVRVNKKIEDTMKMLRLYRKHHCVVLPNKPTFVGMLKRVKDYVTWGEIDEKTFKTLLEKRGKLPSNQSLTEKYVKDKLKLDYDKFVKEFFDFKKELKDIPGLKLYFKLNPPLKGFETKGIKKPYSLGGVLGYRKDDINELLVRMI